MMEVTLKQIIKLLPLCMRVPMANIDGFFWKVSWLHIIPSSPYFKEVSKVAKVFEPSSGFEISKISKQLFNPHSNFNPSEVTFKELGHKISSFMQLKKE